MSPFLRKIFEAAFPIAKADPALVTLEVALLAFCPMCLACRFKSDTDSDKSAIATKRGSIVDTLPLTSSTKTLALAKISLVIPPLFNNMKYVVHDDDK